MDYMEILRANNREELLIYLENHDVNEEVQGQTLLYWAAFMNNLGFCKTLIKQGANVNYKDSLGRSPLSTAIYYGFLEVSKFLLENNAIIDTACEDRAYNGWDGNIQKDVINLLREYGQKNEDS